MEKPDIKTIVKDRFADMTFYRAGYIYYVVTVDDTDWSFPVSLEDIGQATLPANIKAITLMRYIRKALADGTFVKA